MVSRDCISTSTFCKDSQRYVEGHHLCKTWYKKQNYPSFLKFCVPRELTRAPNGVKMHGEVISNILLEIIIKLCIQCVKI